MWAGEAGRLHNNNSSLLTEPNLPQQEKVDFVVQAFHLFEPTHHHNVINAARWLDGWLVG